MARLIRNCALSVIIYTLLFAAVLERPLSLGLLQLELEQKAAALALMKSPKLVILAGSNGPYSHSCTVIGTMLRMPCENAGIAVGIGLDVLFTRYAPFLKPGDVVYMPMELRQYTVTRAQVDAGTDAGLLIRDRDIPAAAPPDRLIGGIFCCTVADFLDSVVEMLAVHLPGLRPGQILAQEYNAEGDRIGAWVPGSGQALLAHPPRSPPIPAEIEAGYGSVVIGDFVRRETARGVIVIGGLPTDFDTVAISARTVAAVAKIYLTQGGVFLKLPNHSQYPIVDFRDSEDHLSPPCQFLNSLLLAPRLAEFLERPVYPARASDLALAMSCPGQPLAAFQTISAAR